MNISRVTTISLVLAVAVFALGYADQTFAGKPVDGKQKTNNKIPVSTPTLANIESVCPRSIFFNSYSPKYARACILTVNRCLLPARSGHSASTWPRRLSMYSRNSGDRALAP